MSKKPNPGTQEAIDMGCKCPVIHNRYGRGYMGKPGLFIFRVDCPVHDWDYRFEANKRYQENQMMDNHYTSEPLDSQLSRGPENMLPGELDFPHNQ